MPDETRDTSTGVGAGAIRVSLNDFPVFDGVGCPDSFISQCRRVATLGGLDEQQLSAIMATRCRGLALQVIENNTSSDSIADILKSAFGAQQRPEEAAMKLSAIKKHTSSVAEYALQIKTLVKKACPELFDQTGSVKKVCAPAYQAALYRHFLTGLTPDERLLLSRQGASSFDAAVRELSWEESIAQESAVASGEAFQSLGVHWADSALAGDRRRVRSASRGFAEAPSGAEWEGRCHPFSKFRDRWTLELIAFRWTPKLRVIEGCILHGKKHWVVGRNIHTVGRDRTIGLF